MTNEPSPSATSFLQRLDSGEIGNQFVDELRKLVLQDRVQVCNELLRRSEDFRIRALRLKNQRYRNPTDGSNANLCITNRDHVP